MNDAVFKRLPRLFTFNLYTTCSSFTIVTVNMSVCILQRIGISSMKKKVYYIVKDQLNYEKLRVDTSSVNAF